MISPTGRISRSIRHHERSNGTLRSALTSRPVSSCPGPTQDIGDFSHLQAQLPPRAQMSAPRREAEECRRARLSPNLSQEASLRRTVSTKRSSTWQILGFYLFFKATLKRFPEKPTIRAQSTRRDARLKMVATTVYTTLHALQSPPRLRSPGLNLLRNGNRRDAPRKP